MTLPEISQFRLVNQKIASTQFKTANEVVSWMGAMQAQDYTMAKWAIGIRLLNPANDDIERSIDNGEIIRTHLMRPTWHFVSADDIYWILELSAPKILTSVKSRNVHLELSETIFKKTNRIIEKALTTEPNLTREELAREIHKAKIPTDNNRLSHILFTAELNGIICSGRKKGGKLTYALLSERVPEKKVYTRDEAMATLAKRYFISHCPATEKDFMWWSGLSATEAKKALESVKSGFISETIGSDKYWMTELFSKTRGKKTSLYLLPAYDEYLISYKDRSASLPLLHNKRTVSSNGIFYPVILHNGQVIGVWKRLTKGERVIIEPKFFYPPDKLIADLLYKEVHRYGKFLKLQPEMKLTGELVNW